MNDVSFRVKAYIENGWADRVINPDLLEGSSSSRDLNSLTRLFYLQLKVGKVSKVHINPWMMYQNFQ